MTDSRLKQERKFEEAVAKGDEWRVLDAFRRHPFPYWGPARALGLAAGFGGPDMVGLLLSHGASFASPPMWGWSDPRDTVGSANGDSVAAWPPGPPKVPYNWYAVVNVAWEQEPEHAKLGRYPDDRQRREIVGLLAKAGEDLRGTLYAAILMNDGAVLDVLGELGIDSLPEETATSISTPGSTPNGPDSPDRVLLHRAILRAVPVNTATQLVRRLAACRNVDRVALRPEDVWDAHRSCGLAEIAGTRNAFPVLSEHTTLLDVADPDILFRVLLSQRNMPGISVALERGLVPDADMASELLDLALSENAQAVVTVLSATRENAGSPDCHLSLSDDPAALSRAWRHEVLDDGTAMITGYMGLSTNARVPALLGGRPVTTISTMAFQEKAPDITDAQRITRHSLRSLVLPSTFRHLHREERDRRDECQDKPFSPVAGSLRELILDDGIQKIPSGLCSGCDKLDAVVLPSSVRTIGERAFSNTGLREVTIPGTVREVGNGAFEQCCHLTHVRVEGATSFEESAFYRCGHLSSVELPDGMTRIPCHMFGLTAIQDLGFLPRSTQTIERFAFSGSELQTAILPPAVRSIGNNAFFSCDSLRRVELSAPARMGWGAFSDCPSLETVHLPEGVKEIPCGCFAHCTRLQDIHLPDGLELIDEEAFQECGLRRIVIPASVTRIRSGAFSECWQLSEVDILGRPSIADDAFADCPSLRAQSA